MGVHVPGETDIAAVNRFHALLAHWPPPAHWASNMTDRIAAVTWHVLRRWRLLLAPSVLERIGGGGALVGNATRPQGCSWLAYIRGDASLNTKALAAVLRHEEALLGTASPVVFGRSMSAPTHGL